MFLGLTAPNPRGSRPPPMTSCPLGRAAGTSVRNTTGGHHHPAEGCNHRGGARRRRSSRRLWRLERLEGPLRQGPQRLRLRLHVIRAAAGRLRVHLRRPEEQAGRRHGGEAQGDGRQGEGRDSVRQHRRDSQRVPQRCDRLPVEDQEDARRVTATYAPAPPRSSRYALTSRGGARASQASTITSSRSSRATRSSCTSTAG